MKNQSFAAMKNLMMLALFALAIASGGKDYAQASVSISTPSIYHIGKSAIFSAAVSIPQGITDTLPVYVFNWYLGSTLVQSDSSYTNVDSLTVSPVTMGMNGEALSVSVTTFEGVGTASLVLHPSAFCRIFNSTTTLFEESTTKYKCSNECTTIRARYPNAKCDWAGSGF